MIIERNPKNINYLLKENVIEIHSLHHLYMFLCHFQYDWLNSFSNSKPNNDVSKNVISIKFFTLNVKIHVSFTYSFICAYKFKTKNYMEPHSCKILLASFLHVTYTSILMQLFCYPWNTLIKDLLDALSFFVSHILH